MSNPVYDVPTLAERWGCSTDTVRALVKSGTLLSFRLGGKLVRIRADEVEKFECRNIACNDTGDSLPSSGVREADAADIRSERLIGLPPRQPRVASGRGGQ